MEPELDRGTFIWNVHSYTNEYIRFADAKAGVVIAWVSAVIAALISTKAHYYFVKATLAFPGFGFRETALGVCSLTAFLALATSFVLAVWTIRPRLHSSQVRGYIFWENIRRYKQKKDYWDELGACDSAGLERTTAEHVWDLAEVCSRKYFWLNLAIYFASVGSSLGCLIVLLS